MKKIIYSLLLFLIFIGSYNISNATTCNQVFEWTTLRYDAWYRFYDIFNAWSKDAYMNDYTVRFTNPEYLDKGSSFWWTQALKNKSYKVSKNTSLRIIETWATGRRIAKHPTTRTKATRSSYDFMIAYDIQYDHSNNYPDSSDDIVHTECKYYSVSWCGDWVLDSAYEVCDPKDSNKKWWGNGWCDLSCKPINVEPPSTCDNITATPSSGLAPLKTTITCKWTNANTYKITCWNGKTINSKTGVCTYIGGWTYTPYCTVNGNITSNACKTEVVVKAPTPLIQVEKYSWNSEDLDWNKNHNKYDDSQTTTIGKKAVFIIEVKNIWNEDLKSVYLNDDIAPGCSKNTTEVTNILKTIWNKDGILNIWESFKYTCEKSNTRSDYVNVINVKWTWVISNKKVSDTDNTCVKIVKPSILIIKTDFNSNDLDWSVWNDTQTVRKWNDAIFKITVKNNGSEDLKEVSIKDIIEPSCNRTVAQTKNLYSGNTFKVWSSFSYTCKKTNTIKDYKNIAEAIAKWVTSNILVDDQDPTIVKVLEENPWCCVSLKVNPLEEFIDFESTFSCTAVWANTYKIVIKNSDWVVVDTINNSTGKYTFTKKWNYLASCYINNRTETENACNKTIIAKDSAPSINIEKYSWNTDDLDWDISDSITNDTQTVNNGDKAVFKIKVTNNGTEDLKDVVITDIVEPSCNRTALETKTLYSGETFKTWDTFTYTCEKSNTTENYTNTAKVVAKWVNSNQVVNDNDPTNVKVKSSWNYDLALRKDIVTTWPYSIGQDVTYKITVTNEWNISATNVEVRDTVPTWLTLNDSRWTLVNPNRVTRVIEWTIEPGQSKYVEIIFTINGEVTWSIKNIAEIIDDDWDDNDSTPDDDDDDQDDQDDEVIIIDDDSLVCEAWVTWRQSSAILESTANLCKNSWESVKNFRTSVDWKTTTYVWDCTDWTATYTGWNCTASYRRGWGSGSSDASCYDIEQSGTQFTCYWNSRANYFWIDCDWDGIYEQVSSSQITFRDATWRKKDVFTCADAWVTPRCAVSKNYIAVNQQYGWTTSNQCKDTIGQSCWNGIIEWNEECEVNSDGIWPWYCNQNACYIIDISTIPWEDWNLTTIPSDWNIGFIGVHDIIIWYGENLSELNNKISIYNNSDYTFGNSVFNWICVTINDINGQRAWDSLFNVWVNQHCTDINTKFYPGQEIPLNKTLNDIVANKDKVDWANYEDNNLVVTVRTTLNTSPYGQVLNWSDHLTGKFKVRVAKPAIQTTSGTSFSNAWANTKEVAADINTDVDYSGKSDNDVWVWTKSSSANTTTDDKVVWDANDYNTNSSIIENNDEVSFTKYNGLDNVFIVKANVNVSDIEFDWTKYSDISESTTYIIDWNLIIDEDVTALHNIAFIVKWESHYIFVNEGIENIKWTYIVLDNGSIKGAPSDKQLIVKGSLYWDITNLVNNRYKVEEKAWELSFGTVVSFGSSIFQKPAPLVTQFINTYLTTQKVAK